MDTAARQLLGVFAILMSLVMLGLGIAVNTGNYAWQIRLMFSLIGLNSWVVAAQGWTWLRLYYDLDLIALTPSNPHLWRARSLAQQHLRELTEAVARGQRDCLVLWEPRDRVSEMPLGWLYVTGMEGDRLLAWHPAFLADDPDTGVRPQNLDPGPYAVPVTGPTALPGPTTVKDPGSAVVPLAPASARGGGARPWPAVPNQPNGRGTAEGTASVGSDEPPPTVRRFFIPPDQVWDYCVPLVPPREGCYHRGNYTRLAQLQTLLDRGYRALPAQRRALQQNSSYEHWGFPPT
jgi:hypothetical protein